MELELKEQREPKEQKPKKKIFALSISELSDEELAWISGGIYGCCTRACKTWCEGGDSGVPFY